MHEVDGFILPGGFGDRGIEERQNGLGRVKNRIWEYA